MEDTKNRIIENAREQFAHYGYKKTNLDDIVHDVKISKATIYNYFKNKEDLFRQVVIIEYSKMFEYLKSQIANEPDAKKQLIIYVVKRTEYIHKFFSKRGSNLVIIKELIETRKQLDEYLPKEVEIFKEIIQNGERKNLFRKKSALNYTSLIYQIIQQFEFRWIEMDKAKYKTEIETLCGLLFHGMA